MFYEIWKAWSLALNKETDQIYELNKQQEDEIKELKTRLQAKENTFLISSTLSVLDLKKYLLKRTDTEKFRIN